MRYQKNLLIIKGEYFVGDISIPTEYYFLFRLLLSLHAVCRHSVRACRVQRPVCGHSFEAVSQLLTIV